MAAIIYSPLSRVLAQGRRSMGHVKYLRMFAHQLKSEAAGAESRESTNESFADIFQRSKFATMLDPVNQNVEGEVLAVVNDNMYVDFGCKFHAVVPVPKERAENFGKGSRVVVRVLDLEMTNHFIGDHKDISLLEAEAELVS